MGNALNLCKATSRNSKNDTAHTNCFALSRQRKDCQFLVHYCPHTCANEHMQLLSRCRRVQRRRQITQILLGYTATCQQYLCYKLSFHQHFLNLINRCLRVLDQTQFDSIESQDSVLISQLNERLAIAHSLSL